MSMQFARGLRFCHKPEAFFFDNRQLTNPGYKARISYSPPKTGGND